MPARCVRRFVQRFPKYRVSQETHIVNLLDESGVYADRGRMVITNLFLKGFPIINYDIGDYAEKIVEKNIEYLTNIQGRIDDVFTFSDGTFAARQPFYCALSKIPEIIQARFIQEDFKLIKIEACLYEHSTQREDEIMNHLIEDIKNNLGHKEVRFEYELFDRLKTDKNGKIRFMQSKVQPKLNEYI